jgi:membrane protease YdiL (CAAX protease family)
MLATAALQALHTLNTLDALDALDALLGTLPPTVFSQPLGAPTPSLLETLGKALFPIPAYLVLAPALWLIFRKTWRQLDLDAHEHQKKTLAEGRYDYRPAVLFVTTALVLTLQEYYGGRSFYEDHIHPFLREVEAGQLTSPGGLGGYVNLRRYNELYSYGWWSFARCFGYVVVPFAVWKLVFRKDSLLDMGLRLRGLLSHAWIYGLCLAVVLPAVVIVSRAPDFGNYYPFYKLASRSWFDLACWEAMYFAQFFALEIFFRGFWLSGLKTTLGSGAIFAMCVPYCMIHYGKPYLEAAGAVVAGIALGSLSMKTKSVYSGFIVHVTVALSMDLLALSHRHALPTSLWGAG